MCANHRLYGNITWYISYVMVDWGSLNHDPWTKNSYDDDLGYLSLQFTYEYASGEAKYIMNK